MNRFLILWVSLLSANLAYANPGALYVHESSKTDSDLQRSGAKRILIVGDSITVSNCNPTTDGVCGWRKFLAEQCGLAPDAYVFDTLSKVGYTAFEANRALPASYAGAPTLFLRKHHYEAAFVLLGVNDIGTGGFPGGPATRQYLKLLGTFPQDTAALQALVPQTFPELDLTALTASYTGLLAKLKTLDVREIFLISVFPTCRFGNSVRPLASLKIRKDRQVLTDLAAGATTDGAAGIPVHFLNVYDDLVETQRSPAVLGCLRHDLASIDHLHPNWDATTQRTISGAIARAIGALPEHGLACGPNRAVAGEKTMATTHTTK